jgi:hypothetical protein
MLHPVRFIVGAFLLLSSSLLSAQVAPPPPPPEGGYQQPEIPRRMWSFGFHAGIIGYSPVTTRQVSGHDHFAPTLNLAGGARVLTDDHGRQRYSIVANTSIGLVGGVMLASKNRRVFHNIEVLFERNKACYTFIPPFPFMLDGRQFGNWVDFDKYFNAGISYEISFLSSGFVPFNADGYYFRTTFSQTFAHRNTPNKFTPGYTEDWTENGTGMRLRTTQVNPASFMLNPEIGLRTFNDDQNRTWECGIVAHIALAPTFTNRYEFLHNNNSSGVSDVTYHGTTVMINMRYTFYGQPKQKPVDTATPPPDIYVHSDTTREVDVQESFTVNNKRVKITVWDRNEVDGDIVTLFMNDELVKKNLRLKKRKKRFTVKLKPGSNILVMYAENLGDIPPNTAALQIKDGKKKRNVNLVSDNGKSGAVELIYQPK